MEVFVARQPIFNENEKVISYELLYRNNKVNAFPNIDGDQATADVIINSFLNIGIDNLSSGLPCFINFTENLLQQRVPTYFPPREIVVEILENILPSPELLNICLELRNQGYRIALDDYIFHERNIYSLQLLKVVDIVKVDFLNTDEVERKKIETIVKQFNIKLLAEKVENREQFELAKKSGYSFFQGYFFSKPVIVSTFDIPASFNSYFQIINKLSYEDVSFESVSQIIEQDLSLSYKLLKLINSPAYRPKHKIHSIPQAIILLGLIEIKRWIYVLAVRENAGWRQQLSDEIKTLCLTRAKCCEIIAEKYIGRGQSPSYFLLGLFSLMDTILSIPMETILDNLPLEDTIYNALCGEENEMRVVLELVIAIEKGEWDLMDRLLNKSGIDSSKLPSIYQQALQWSMNVLNEDYLD
ncbi:EAL and HDOD domain-containing protein [Heyndrickxia vini]|uniref:EAL domain-containing protein n=1 Tax=Heyndrickxia vini TaxID=1476025 RepID=A0ABX7E7B7_9BACI|nr:HDOD domain-containing protein [Heyndrickxia vini]QQZ11126.1 EAL domain-containing protein [Heyndrickxia vini]